MQNELQIKVTVSGDKTIGDLRREVRALDKDFDNLSVGNIEGQKALAAQIVILKDQIASLRSVTQSSNAKMKESYFVLGEELRRKAMPAMQEMSRIVQDMPYGIQGVSNNVTQLVSNFTNLRMSAGSTMGALQAMGSAMLGPAGVLMGVSLIVSALPKLIELLADKSKAVQDLNKAWVENAKLMHDLGRMSDEQYVKELERQKSDVVRQRNIMATSPLDVSLAGVAMKGAAGAGADAAIARAAQLIELDNKILNIQKQIDSVYSSQLKKVNNIVQLEAVTVTPAGRMPNGYVGRLGGGPGAGILGGKSFDMTNPWDRMSAGAMSGLPGEIKMKTIPETEREFGAFESAFMSGIGSITNSISSQIGGAFASVFGGAKTLLGNFVGMFMQALAEMAIRAAALFAFSSIFGAVSIGTGGAAVGAGFPVASGGNAGAIGIGLAQSRTRINNLNINVPEIAARIENDAIVLAYERGKLVRQNRIL